MSDLFEKISGCLLEREAGKIQGLVKQALDAGLAPKDILNKGLLAGMSEVGVLFKEGELFVPEVLLAAKTMALGMETLGPELKDGEAPKKGKVVLATVKGDLHDIGIKLVGLMLEGAGYEVINMGLDVPPETIVKAVAGHQPKILGLCALLTTTLGAMKDSMEALREAGLYNNVKVIVGGAVVTDNYAKDIGAHYAADAVRAVDLADQLAGA
ncbi:corrinoid protein [Sporomusa malonica]|uniref:5-methyltetrahydrofolate--homocysteine methyltransferase n=1 Tax=Sporomusa malonica TaxID=112901 RepID=A0A1W1ZCA3_9FIRM|nr:corrinoid protein [Sporomusa malonica]SMC45902.1 5-methyltetrahydrofolate--homocysteine methyltransferase [Sporomusa malonica]